MKVILKENVESLGKVGEIVKVADGFARNYLIPKGLAMEASMKNVNVLEHEKNRIVQRAEKERKIAEDMAVKISAVTCTIARRVGEQDKLFGSVGTKDIEKALADHDITLDKKNIHLSEPIKTLGEFAVTIKLSGGVSTELKVVVLPEE